MSRNQIELNGFAKAMSILKEIFASDPTVNSIGWGVANEEDFKQETNYPLVYISPDPTGGTGNTNIFRFEIFSLAQRVGLEQVQEDSTYFESKDNFLDNLNSTFAILNRCANKLRGEYGDFINDDWFFSANPLSDRAGNLLDGWSATFEIELPNRIC